jgi:hypothetical protein
MGLKLTKLPYQIYLNPFSTHFRMTDTVISVKTVIDTQQICPASELRLAVNHPITAIKVEGVEIPFRLRINGFMSKTESKDGVLKISDLNSSFFQAMRKLDGLESRHLTAEQNDQSINFSRIDSATLVFNGPLDPTKSYEVSCTMLRAYKDGVLIYH